MFKRRPWLEELSIVDLTMKAISGITDPAELVDVYWQGIGKLVTIENYVAVSRRGIEPPFYLVTRSSRFIEELNPWTQRDRLPRMTGGLLGEVAFANKPIIINDLPDRLSADDPGRFYLEGFQHLIGLPQYDDGEGINATAMLLPAGSDIDMSMIPMLHWQAGLFGRGTQNLVLRNQLSGALATLDKELQAVGDIQRSLLPDVLPSIEGFELAASYDTSARAGGDYYDFFPLEDGRWGLFIADVSGHGTPAAVLMAITHAIAHAKPDTHTPPAMLLQYLNDRLTRVYTRGGTFVTAFYAVLDPKARTLTYARAGHNPPRLARGDRVIPMDAASGLPLGIVSDQPYEQAVLAIEPGDLLLLYTDGITEAMSPLRAGESRDLFGVDRLDKLLLNCRPVSARKCIATIRDEVSAFGGHAQPTDDQTLIAIQYVE